MKRLLKRGCLLAAVLALLSLFLLNVSAADTVPQEDLKAMVNALELHPQKTGYAEVDQLLEEILAPYAGEDTYTRLKAAYDWTVMEISYSWAPYSQDWAPAYDCFVPVYDLSYADPGLQEVVPFEIVNRSYHAITYHEGVCYDYAAVFALLARYIGIDSYVHTGYFQIEPTFGSYNGHHGWTELCINGVNYIFDPQRDYRWSWNATSPNPYYYFGVPYENAWRYDQEEEINAQRDALFLPVSQERSFTPEITVWATASGMASGAGKYAVGETVTVFAWGDRFMAWYDREGNLLSTSNPYQFTAEKTMVVKAVFANEQFTDIPADAWYREAAVEAAYRGLIKGTSTFTFSANSPMTRAMAITVLFRASADRASDTPPSYSDVEAGSWYADAVQWATEREIVNGVGKGKFDPEGNVTREQFATMLMRYAAYAGLKLPEAQPEGTDADSISDYAVLPLGQAQSLGIMEGYPDGSLHPLDKVTRAEAVTMLLRLLDLLAAE